MLLWMWACAEPGLLDKVSQQLSAGVLDDADPALRLGVELGSLAAEICPMQGTGTVDEGDFDGWGSDALTLGELRSSVAENGSRTFTFNQAGLHDHPGNVNILTSPEWDSFSFTWHGDDKASYIGSYTIADCSSNLVVVGGGGTYTDATGVSGTTALIGDNSGMVFDQSQDVKPTAGQARWTSADKKDTVELDSAEDADVDGAWTAQLSGPSLKTEVIIQFP